MVQSSIEDIRHRIGNAPMPTAEAQEILCILDLLAEHIATIEANVWRPNTHTEQAELAKGLAELRSSR